MIFRSIFIGGAVYRLECHVYGIPGIGEVRI